MNKISKEKVSRASSDTFLFPKFANKVYETLQKKFPQTYFVGGAVRNSLLHQKISDIDIATSATPNQVKKLLQQNKISFSDDHVNFGVMIAKDSEAKVINKTNKIEITTFRKDSYTGSRFPSITFTKTPKSDSIRRDFTINALYYSPKKKEVLDFHNGLTDIKKKQLKFIGNPNKRIQEDPLRIVRAYRFQLQYNLKFEKNTETAIRNNINLLKNISKTRIEREINLVKTLQRRKMLKKVIHNMS